jgi:hypothetical protein
VESSWRRASRLYTLDFAALKLPLFFLDPPLLLFKRLQPCPESLKLLLHFVNVFNLGRRGQHLRNALLFAFERQDHAARLVRESARCRRNQPKPFEAEKLSNKQMFSFAALESQEIPRPLLIGEDARLEQLNRANPLPDGLLVGIFLALARATPWPSKR